MTKQIIKFVIDVPTTVLQAIQLDEQNNNDIWANAIQRESKCDCGIPTVGGQQINCSWIKANIISLHFLCEV